MNLDQWHEKPTARTASLRCGGTSEGGFQGPGRKVPGSGVWLPGTPWPQGLRGGIWKMPDGGGASGTEGKSHLGAKGQHLEAAFPMGWNLKTVRSPAEERHGTRGPPKRGRPRSLTNLRACLRPQLWSVRGHKSNSAEPCGVMYTTEQNFGPSTYWKTKTKKKHL